MSAVEAIAEVRPAREQTQERDRNIEAIKGEYLVSLSLIERLHRLLLDVVKDEFERVGRIDINSVQALLLFNIGEEELSAGDLKARGYYQGSNVSYNLKKLVESGYLHHERCNVDRRSVRIRLTAKGVEVRDLVSAIYDRHVREILNGEVGDMVDFDSMNGVMQRLETFWRSQIRYIY